MGNTNHASNKVGVSTVAKKRTEQGGNPSINPTKVDDKAAKWVLSER
ncbi:unnamed protein product, partial [Rotaria socialis]